MKLKTLTPCILCKKGYGIQAMIGVKKGFVCQECVDKLILKEVGK